ncbi:MAG: hypothetical protein RBT49_04575 [Bacteroidales bacterium]|jgi:hypothetical protein|nr:hypothetical protein [Bacteroidales bacterium]
MASIADFVSKFQHGARSTLYRVDIPGRLSEDTKFFFKAAQFPNKTINKIEMRYMNNIIPVAGETATFQDWTVTVVNDVNFGLRTEIERWMESIKNNSQTNGATNQNQYFGQAVITQILQDGTDSNVAYDFFNIWPSDLSTIEVGYDNADTVQEYTVTLVFSHWERR